MMHAFSTMWMHNSLNFTTRQQALPTSRATLREGRRPNRPQGFKVKELHSSEFVKV